MCRTKYNCIDLRDMEHKRQKRQELLAKSERWFITSTISASPQAKSSGSPVSHGLPFSQASTGSTCDQPAYDALFARSPSTGDQSSSSGIDPLLPASDVGTLLSELTRTQRGDGTNNLNVEPEIYPDRRYCDASRDLSTVHQASQPYITLDHFPSLYPDSGFAEYVHEGTDTSADDPDFYSPDFDFRCSQTSTAVRDDETDGEDYSTRRRETDGHSMMASSDADPPFDLGEFVNTPCFHDV
jgi:hypothetical protein